MNTLAMIVILVALSVALYNVLFTVMVVSHVILFRREISAPLALEMLIMSLLGTVLVSWLVFY